MKVLLVTYWAYPHTGGVFTYLKILQSRLEELGHEVEMLAQHPSLAKYYLLKNGMHIDKKPFLAKAEREVRLRFERDQIKPTPWMLWRESEKFAFELVCREIAFDQYDVIHTQDIISTFVCRMTKPDHVPLIATIHGCLATEWIASNEIVARSQAEREYLSAEEYYGSMSADFLILPSRWLSRSLLNFQVNHPRSYIIQYGLNQQYFDKISCVSDSSINQIIIACPARLVAIKGQYYLLKAMRMLVDVRKDVVCWLIGDGVMRNDLELQTEKLGLKEHIMLLGNRTDVPQLISKADIVVLPSLQDNLPFSIIESQSLGKPVIASRVGGIVEMIEDGVNGQLVEPGNAQDLFEKLLLLVEDMALREEQSREARKHALTIWNDSIMIDQTIDVYEKSMKDGGHSPLWEQEYTARLNHDFPELGGAEDVEDSVTALKGIVTDIEAMAPVQDVWVHLIDISGFVLRSTKSDEDGNFEFQDVQPGNYELGWTRDLKRIMTKKITVTANPITVDVMV
ncbi:glycosyltransferase involved in cell wall biosynthesis [Fontibacillus solani]|uniref:Glycosyltransferase involved in cell wall biosynthesis n=1 Tax=Fontibacillus solani TaxID=1572857 RepID=A0A7W3SQW9_9BACL|nr:glycosyltransferase [Fontibacillus solani]MBA9084538.1 glycosyltransferase involved in cell wall biosynthesis [Fontibacillus solani]